MNSHDQIRSELEQLVQTLPFAEQLDLPRSRRDMVVNLQVDARAEHWGYFRSLGQLGGAYLDRQLAEKICLVEAADPSARDWCRNQLVPQMHPAVALAYVTRAEYDPAALIELLDHPLPTIVSAALHHLPGALVLTQVSPQALANLRGELEDERPGATDRLEIILAEADKARDTLSRHLASIESILALRAATMPDLLLAAASDARRGGPIEEPLVKALSRLPHQEIGRIADEAIAHGRSAGDWHGTEIVYRVAEQAGAAPIASRIADACRDHFIMPAQPPAHRPDTADGLIVIGLMRQGRGAEAAFMEAVRAEQQRALLLSSGRYTPMREPAIAEAALRSMAALGLRPPNPPNAPDIIWNEQCEWLRRMVEVAADWPDHVLWNVARHVLSTIEMSSAEEVAAGVRLISCAVESEHFTHAWGWWLPEDVALRRRLIDDAHPNVLHDAGAFVLNTERRTTGFLELYAAYLDTGCADCQKNALQRLAELQWGPPVDLARALLATPPSDKLIEQKLHELLSWPLHDPALIRLRAGLVRATRDLAPTIDVDHAEARCAWRTRMENAHLFDGDRIWYTGLRH